LKTLAAPIRGLLFIIYGSLVHAQTQPPAATMTIQVQIPAGIPAGDTIWIMGGQLFNIYTPGVQMNQVAGQSQTWQATISAPAGTIFRYYFARNNDSRKQEIYAPFWPNGYSIGGGVFQRQPPLRELLVVNGATVVETVAAWLDVSPAAHPTGTISGNVADQTGAPLMGIWISAGPHQTFTDATGVFQMQGIPAGPATITARSENGEYAAVNTKVNIAADQINTQNISLTAQPMFDVTLNLIAPAATPASAIPRILGDTYKLGLVQVGAVPGPDPARYAEMSHAAGSQWTFTTQLGKGTCINYLYTLGDHSVDFERKSGSPNVIPHALCVDGPTTVNDTVESWQGSTQVPVTLNATSPKGANETLYVVTDGFNPTKMWQTGPGTATITLYVNPNTRLNYRYVRDGDSSVGAEIIGGQDTNLPATRSVNVGTSALKLNDTISAWRNQMLEPALTTVTSGITGPVAARSEPFQTGIEMIDYWRPSWLPLVASTASRIKSIDAKWIMIVANWTPTIINPPQAELIYDDFPPQDLIAHIRAAKSAGLHVALRSQTYPNDFDFSQGTAYTDAVFQMLQSFSVYYAQIAKQEGVEMLLIESIYIVNNSKILNGNPTLRSYISAKFKSIIAAIRAAGYTGKLTTDSYINFPEYDWYGQLDYLGDRWGESTPIATSDNDSVQSMTDKATALLTSRFLPGVNRYHKPFIFTSVEYYSAHTSALQTYSFGPQIFEGQAADPTVASDYDEQGRVYQAVLRAFAATPWVQGAYSFGYTYSDLDSKGYSIRGKTAEQIVSQVYRELNASFTGPAVTSVVSAADFKAEAQSPGAWVSIFGQNLGQAESATIASALTLGGVSVTVCGTPAILNFNSGPVTVSGSTLWQINALLPDSIAGQKSCTVVVTVGGESSAPASISIAGGVMELFQFTVSAGTLPIVTHADYTLVGPASAGLIPAKPNETVVVWATGDCSTPNMTVAGKSATVVFSGRVGPGLCQVNFVVPGTASGTSQLRLSSSPDAYDLWISP
jgi:uncharacterized protein (TIGR03437 family)